MWNDSVLPSLGGLVKAMYAVGRFTSVADDTATLALPNDVHRQKCEQKRTEVEAALAERLGRPLTLRLVTDDVGPDEGAAIRHDGAPPPRHPTDDEAHLDGQDVHDLDDAPDARSGGLDALTEAFPGSEFVEDS